MADRWLAERPADEPLFSRLPKNTARMLRADLKASRTEWIAEAPTDSERAKREASDFLEYQNAAGEVFDFHAARHTFISQIVAGGASVKVAQELARHSTPILTIGRYSHTRLHDLQGALESLPNLSSERGDDERAEESVPLRATGTDGRTENKPATSQRRVSPESTAGASVDSAQRQAQRIGRGTLQLGASRHDSRDTKRTPQVSRKALVVQRKRETMQLYASPREKHPLGE